MVKKSLNICIVGKTNAGKSTLINNLVGEIISISNKKINTTEELITGIRNVSNTQLVFYDTPGINYIKNTKIKNTLLKKNLWNGIDTSDIFIYLIDSKTYNFKEVVKNLNILNRENKEIIIVFNKLDLIDVKFNLSKIRELNSKFIIDAYFSISAKKNLGLEKLIKYLLTKAYKNKWKYNNEEVSNKSEEFICIESTRNAALTLLHKEIPYNIKIYNKIFKYLNNGDLKIKQEIEINNLRYKKIILGKKGEKIKQIRIKSQKYLSKILKTKVHLYLNIIKSNVVKI